ncbi:SCO0930 family lipoprotein [Streptomyces sp. NPDC048057]|uniref:SCO0930 family lipoprotein n=1 Tax=Streptomyces sp. NPDC048057 TaxID=3155628 RepID=UPI00340E25F5
MWNWRSATVTATGTVAALLLTACGGEDGGDKKADSVAQTPVAAQGQAAGVRPATAGKLSIWKSGPLGPVVTDSAGFTLYRFDDDTASPSKSTCDGDCAKAWPPVLAADAAAAEGMDAKLLGRVTRSDGTQQLTLKGWPLYRFAKDTQPRQTNGQGVGGTWFAAAPDGNKATGAAAGATTGGGSGEGTGSGTGEQAGAALAPLSVRKDAELGPIVRDAKGRTLYRFTKDTDWPMKSNCTGPCLEKWKPAKMLDKAALKGVQGIDPKQVIEYERPDGTRQLTIDCWPLYWFTGDKAPGDTSGQGVGGTWFAVRADGKLAR